ncbi:zinc finger and BTB domain-containing protein 24-like isoform X2 [Mercenaria mercenaria]|nr:zinc finger and BTB domain-containing protein 24-like isoform X2 [Mercenaria mercenaria]
MDVLEVAAYSAHLLEQMNTLRQEKMFCDVTIACQNSTMAVHRLVLQAASPYFDQRIKKSENGECHIDLCHLDESLLQTVIEFLYSSKLKVCKDTVENIMEICDELHLQAAVDACNFYIEFGNQRRKDIDVQTDTIINETMQDVINETPVRKKRKTASKQADSLADHPIKAKKTETAKPQRTRKAYKPRQRKALPKKEVNTKKAKAAEIVRDEPNPVKSEGNGKKTDMDTEVSAVDNETVVKIERDDSESEKVQKEIIEDENDEDDIEDDSDTDDYDSNIVEDNPDADAADEKIKRIDKDGRVLKKRGRKKKEGITEGKPKKRRRRKPFPCSMCSKTLTSKKRQIFHEYSKHGTPIDFKNITFTVSPCEVQGCNYVAANPHNLDMHMKSRHGNARPHICEFCGKAFKLPNILATHLNIHTGSKSWKCDHCGESFNQQSGLQVHVKRYHMGESSWTEMCHMCSEKFLQKADLAWHLFKVHGQQLPDNYKMYVCDICGFSTMKSQQLKQHRERHDGIKNFICPICSKGCSTKSELRRHISFHGEKKYKCTFEGCAYACTDTIGLDKHIKLMHTHKDFKPYACPVCQYRTGVKGNVDKHIRTVHDLVVVTKHTVNLKMKYSNFDSGDVITKDGRLVATAKERKALQQVPTIDKEIGQEADMSSNANNLTYADYKVKESADNTYSNIKKSKRHKGYRVDTTNLPDSDLSKHTIPTVVSDQTDTSKMETIIHDLPPLSNYVYIHGDITAAQDLRLSGINPADTTSLYNIGSAEMFNMQNKY